MALELDFHIFTWRSPRGNSAHSVLVFSPHLSSYCSRLKKKKKITCHQNGLYNTVITPCSAGNCLSVWRPQAFDFPVVKKLMLSAWVCMMPSKTWPVRWVWPVFWAHTFPSPFSGNEKLHSARRGLPSRVECVEQESCFPFTSEHLRHRGPPVVMVSFPLFHLTFAPSSVMKPFPPFRRAE